MTLHSTQWWKFERLTTRSVDEDVKKLELSYPLERTQIGTSEQRHCLSKLCIDILYNSAISLLDIQPKEMHTYVHQKTGIRMFIEALFIIVLCMYAQSLSRVWLFASPWTVAYQAPLSQGSNLCLPHWQADSLPLSHLRGSHCLVPLANSAPGTHMLYAYVQQAIRETGGLPWWPSG